MIAAVKVGDEYPIAAILPVFFLRLCELFIGRMDAAERSEGIGRLLLVKSLDIRLHDVDVCA